MKNIAIFTSARSEYGLLKPLIETLNHDPAFHVHLLVGGGHFSHEQGFTVNEIIADGMTIAASFPFLIHDPSSACVSRSNGLLQLQISEYFLHHPIDLLIVLGDRSELIAVVSSALFQAIPIAHISGGEVTEGATDNQVRHAVTKMSHLHFPATQTYQENLLRMGEEAWRICVAGETGLDSILSMPFPSKAAFFERYQLSTDQPLLLATLHSETIQQSIDAAFLTRLIEQLLATTSYQLLFTAANTDHGGTAINATLEQLAQQYPRLTFVRSLGKSNYYAALRYADLVLGNSSSGLVEAQSFNVPVVNVGSRQDGRLRNANVLDAPVEVNAILTAIEAVTQASFTKQYEGKANIYGDGKACERIIQFLHTLDWSKLLLKRSVF